MDKCSFCGKSERQVSVLVRGPGVTICNECVVFFYEEVLTDSQRDASPGRSLGSLTGRDDSS